MAKNIVLCSDGTGKKGGYGNNSNVYKLYQAVDIHNSKTPQISFYDNGIGTKEDGSAVKSNKIWIALSGVLGLGFIDKVRDLYEFLARHYRTGDKIYIFGFSRGAATVRALTGFIECCGLIDKSKIKSEADFQKRINQALQAYEKIKSNPGLASAFKESHAINGKDYAPDANLQIHFLGVWDTVSALGFPDGDWKTSDCFFKTLDWVSRGLEKWTDKHWPHQFYNYKLNDSILYACQALAIDDERKTFHPKIWNENERKPGSVDQVWFSGAHSNIGGGYPRSGLSNVALEWIFKQATEKGLVFLKDDVDAIKAHANVQGKLYDSRDGFGVYYRYEPRNIEKLCFSQETNQPKIEAGKIKIHNTVIERVKQETALYTPGFLPAQFQMTGTDSKQKTELSFDKEKYDNCREKIYRWVEKRQWLYRTFVEISLFVFVSVLLLWVFPPESVKVFLQQEATQTLSSCQDFSRQCFAETITLIPPQRWLYGSLSYIFPAIFKNFIVYVVAIQPLIFIVMMGTIITLYRLRKRYQIKLCKALAKQRILLLETFNKL